MSKTINLTLPDDVLRRAEAFAQRSGQDISEVLTDAIEVSLDPLGFGTEDRPSLKDLSDEKILAACDATMAPAYDSRLTELLARCRTTQLSFDEHNELRTLMQLYQEGLLQKAFSLGEAVRRGLRQAPRP